MATLMRRPYLGYGMGNIGIDSRGLQTVPYQSGFQPIPMEFVQQQLGARQQRYDLGYGTAIQTLDKYSNFETDPEDIARKNSLIDSFTEDINTLVQDKFQGDWGKAAKTVAKNVTKMRQDPFWDLARQAKVLRSEERKLRAQFGPEALPFKSLVGKSVYDPEQGYISPEDLTYDIEQRLNDVPVMESMWNQIPEIQRSLEPEKVTIGGETFLKYGATKGISRRQVLDYLDNAFERYQQTNNYKQRFREYTEMYGMDHEDANEMIRDQLYATGLERVGQSSDVRYTSAGSSSGSASSVPQAVFGSAVVGPAEQLRDYKKKGWQRRGSAFNDSGRVKEKSPVNLTDPGTAILSFIQNNRIDKVSETVSNIRKAHPEYDDLTDQELYDLSLDSKVEMNVSNNMYYPVANEDANKAIATKIVTNPTSVEWRISGVTATTNYYGNNGVYDEIGIDVEALSEMIEDDFLTTFYNFSTGEYGVEVPKVKDIKRNADGSINYTDSKIDFDKTTRVYYKPDEKTRAYSNALQTVENSIATGDSIKIGSNQQGFKIEYTPMEGKIVKDKSTEKLLTYTGYLPRLGAVVDHPISLSELRQIMLFLNSKHLAGQAFAFGGD